MLTDPLAERTFSGREPCFPAAWHTPAPALIRPARPGDAAAVDRFVRELSPQSRQRRFHGGIRFLSSEQLARFTQVDGARERLLLALTADAGDEICIGEARYALSDEAPDHREFALAVADGWQGRGLGRRLLAELCRHASQQGVRILYGDVLRDNLPMLTLASRLGFLPGSHPSDARLVRLRRAAVAGRRGFAAAA